MFTHSLNPYTTRGYYYLTDSRSDIDSSIPTEGSGPSETGATTFTERIYHEAELTTPAESGHQLVGEDFRFSPNRTFNIPLRAASRTPKCGCSVNSSPAAPRRPSD